MRHLGGDGQHSSEYDARVTDGILGEAAHLLRTIGFSAHHVILIGGMVPGLLVLDPPSSTRPHVGTTDLDFCLSIALVEGQTAEYERIEIALKAAGYVQQDASFRWQRTSGLRPTVEFFCPAGEGRPIGTLFRPQAAANPVAKQNMGSTLSALALHAGGAIDADVVEVTRDVELPDGRGRIDQTFRLSGLVGFLVAKVAALTGRDKPKDAYDIVWLLEAWAGGPRGAAATVRSSAAFERSDVQEALASLELEFSEVDRVGPLSYARFVAADGVGAEARARLALHARGAVQAFATALR